MFDQTIQNIVSAAADHAEVRLQRGEAHRVSVLSGKLVGNVSSESAGGMARVYKNGVWGVASSCSSDAAELGRLFAAASENASLLDARRPKNRGGLPAGVPVFREDGRTIRRTEQKQLIDFAMTLDAYIGGRYPGLLSRSVGLIANCGQKTLYTSNGGFSFQIFPRCYAVVSMSADTPDGDPVELFDVFGGGAGFFDEFYCDPADLYEGVDRLYAELMQKREGVFPDAGVRTCVIDSAISGMIAHEAVGHTVEADFVLAGSVAKGAVGQTVASPLIHITDFAHTAFGQAAPLPVFVDDEGTLCTDAPLIRNGVLTGYMHNSESAAAFGMENHGNARANAFADEPLIRMRNTAIHPGKDKLEDMIASVQDGYYLTRTQNGQADTTGEFMFGITSGYEIKNGKLGRALRDTTISGVAFQTLKTVDMLSDGVCWDFAGHCGKKQPIAVSMGGPAIRCLVNIGGR